MSSALAFPIQPMLAKAAPQVPPQPDGAEHDRTGPVWSYEPKWDGFRVIIFRTGRVGSDTDVILCSRAGKDLGRYFPEMLDAARAELPEGSIVDGELVVPRTQDGYTRLDWEALSARIHPAASRVELLAVQDPAQFIAFDLLALGGRDLTGERFRERRRLLLENIGGGHACHVTNATVDAELAQDWFSRFEGAGLDGVIAKRLDSSYLPNKREMVKVKHSRNADCVLMGFRLHKSKAGVGSLVLGLYDAAGELRIVGGASAFTDARRAELLAELEPLRAGDVIPGEASRWSSAAEKSWTPLRPERVVEVGYDQMEGMRFRHAARFLRWRPDRDPNSCGFAQLELPAPYDLADVLAGTSPDVG